MFGDRAFVLFLSRCACLEVAKCGNGTDDNERGADPMEDVSEVFVVFSPIYTEGGGWNKPVILLILFLSFPIPFGAIVAGI